MKCLILAAGYATRLYPLTENFPKPLLKVKDKAILDWLLEDLEASGLVDEFAVITNSKFAGIFRTWSDERPGCKVSIVDDGTSTNETRLGAVRDIRFAVECLHLDDDLLVMAGDNLLDFSLLKFIEYFRTKRSSCIMRYFESDKERLRKCGVVEADSEDLVLGMEEKPAEPRSSWCCPPFYCFTRKDVCKVAEGIVAGCGTDAPGSFIAWLSSQVPVHAMKMPGKRYDIGNIQSYSQVCENYEGRIL